ncbi:MAG: DUF4389 domain-containing protein [Mariprofundus sp.]
MNDDLKENVMDTSIWLRLVFMLVFAVVFMATRVVLVVVIAVQFLWVLFTREKNDKLLDFGSRLATFIYQIYRYLTFNSEKRPFPFDDFPSADALLDDNAAEATEIADAEQPVEKAAEEDTVEKKNPVERKTPRKPAAKKAAEDNDAASETGVETGDK